MTQKMAHKIQHGLEGTPGSLVAATFVWKGNGKLKFLDSVRTPELEYAVGRLGGNVEGAFIPETGSELTLEDTPLSAETMIWLGNMGIKQVLGAASSFAFPFPSSSPNTISTFTWEYYTPTQEYEFGYGFAREFNLHGDVNADNGAIMCNAVIVGRKAAASTATSSLGFLANYEPLSINYATFHIDALGTAAGTASATSGALKAFNLDVVTGWTADAARYADGRSALDFSTPTFTNYEISGTLKLAFGSVPVTQIANARAGTAIVVGLKLNGSSSREIEIALPLVFTDTPEIGNDSDGLHIVEFPFRSAYSRTSTAQAPSITVTASASTTVT